MAEPITRGVEKQDTIRLTLLGNSHAYLREAVKKAGAGSTDPHQWQFAILLLVQSLELTLKAKLHEMHPAFVFTDIDKQKHTVSLDLAVSRLCNKAIGGLVFFESDKEAIAEAQTFRHQVTHADYELTTTKVIHRFYDIFVFVRKFQRQHLDVEVHDLIPNDDLVVLRREVEFVNRLHADAERRIAEAEDIDADSIWPCPDCGGDTMVVADDIATCWACGHRLDVVECPHCGNRVFDGELEDFSNLIDSDYDDGEAVIHNDFGYKNFSACSDCLGRIEQDIENQRSEDDDYWRMREYEASLARRRP